MLGSGRKLPTIDRPTPPIPHESGIPRFLPRVVPSPGPAPLRRRPDSARSGHDTGTTADCRRADGAGSARGRNEYGRGVRTKWAALAAISVSVALSVGMLTGCNPVDSTTVASTTSPASTGGTTADPSCGGPATTEADALKVITGAVGCPGGVNTFWSQQLGSVWTTPRFIVYRDGEIPADQCGAQDKNADDFKGNAFYCRLDDTVAYSQDFMARLYKQGGPSYPMFVLMHELGHRVTRLTNRVGVVSRSEENQADCLAGTEAKFTHDAKRLPGVDVAKGSVLFFSLGDSWFHKESPSDPDAHGTPDQRAAAFITGYTHDVKKCFALGQSQTGSVPLTGLLG
nr:neutral zinc metallopeptidase [Pseudofrankia sp. DC12]